MGFLLDLVPSYIMAGLTPFPVPRSDGYRDMNWVYGQPPAKLIAVSDSTINLKPRDKKFTNFMERFGFYR
eukprot:12907613-Prorocentrum_lima.AAC.1